MTLGSQYAVMLSGSSLFPKISLESRRKHDGHARMIDDPVFIGRNSQNIRTSFELRRPRRTKALRVAVRQTHERELDLPGCRPGVERQNSGREEHGLVVRVRGHHQDLLRDRGRLHRLLRGKGAVGV